MSKKLEQYSDEELGRLLRAAARSKEFAERETISNFEAFCAFLSAVGLGFVADAITLATWAWERVRSIWSGVMRATYQYCGKGDGCDCGLPKVCARRGCTCSRPKVCVVRDCSCSLRKMCDNLACNCGLPKVVL